MAQRIEDYALIGDCETAALVGRDGSIDWLCWPRFDSTACFAALLGTADNGYWRIAPTGAQMHTTRRYRDGTLILETDFEGPGGAVTLVDFMPVRGAAPDLVRIAIGQRGRMRLRMELVIRFDYGKLVPWVTRAEDGTLHAVGGPNRLVLRTDVQHSGENLRTIAEFDVAAGQYVPFVLTYGPSHKPPPHAIDPGQALKQTEHFWRTWSGRCNYAGEWSDAVLRSLVTTKALIHRPTGGIVAAPTTSLPEQFGGPRNWDYRFSWLRDATFTLLCLMHAGYTDEASAWRDWLLRAVAGSPAQIQPLYGVGGERLLREQELEWLPGYEGAAPVRIGNAAHGQLQLDVFGEVLDVMYQARHNNLAPMDAGWNLQTCLVDHLTTIWEQPDEGIWEVRGGPQHFTYSKAMAWVALDRAVKSIEEFGLKGPLDRWKALRAKIHDDVCEKGYNKNKGTFVQAYGSDQLDASLLLLPLIGFLPAEDERIRKTVAAIEHKLVVDGFVLRYDSERTKDGLPPGEGAFLACSFWLVDNLVLQGRHAEAQKLFERLLGLRNDVGLLAEEYDPHARRMLGNFPQAFSHLSLVDTAYNLTRVRGPARERGTRDKQHRA